MFIVLLDEPGLFVFASPAEAAGAVEPPDAESEIRAAFDEAGVPYRVEWIRPNRRSNWLGFLGTIVFGEYRFVPAGPADRAALATLLERHADVTNPPEAEMGLKSLLREMRAS